MEIKISNKICLINGVNLFLPFIIFIQEKKENRLTSSLKLFVMGKLAEIKTKENSASVEDFINGVPNEQKRKDSFVILRIMEKVSKKKPKMWGSSIIGFGNRIYESPATGRQVEWFKIGFSPRKANLTIYLMGLKRHIETLKKLGKHKTGGGCLYINKLGDIDLKILEKIIKASVK